MPLITSLSLMRPASVLMVFPASPHQFASRPRRAVGWSRRAGVHSIVWIFANSAVFMSLARSNRSSSDQPGYSARSLSQIALCSRVKSVCSMTSPIQKPGSSAGCFLLLGSTGIRPSVPIFSLPSSLELSLLVVAVDLRAVPPVGVNVDVGRRRPFLFRFAVRIFLRPEDAHRSFGPRIVVRKRYFPGIVLGALTVAQPIAQHELYPRCSKQVERFGRNEGLAPQKLTADGARVGLHEPFVVGMCPIDGDVTTEARAYATHPGVFEVIVGACRGARAEVTCAFRRGYALVGPRLSIVEVLSSQPVAIVEDGEEPERPGQLGPLGGSGGPTAQAFEQGHPGQARPP